MRKFFCSILVVSVLLLLPSCGGSFSADFIQKAVTGIRQASKDPTASGKIDEMFNKYLGEVDKVCKKYNNKSIKAYGGSLEALRASAKNEFALVKESFLSEVEPIHDRMMKELKENEEAIRDEESYYLFLPRVELIDLTGTEGAAKVIDSAEVWFELGKR